MNIDGQEPATGDPTAQPVSAPVVALTGLSFLFVGLGFSYLDRRFQSFGFEALLWSTWTLLGFGAGALHVRKPGASGRIQWVVLGSLGFVLAVFPGLAIYNLLRWTSLTLMIVVGARAAVLSTRRDFYLTLTVVFVVSFMVGTHGNADWTLWFYLGPAWVFGALALTWEQAIGVPLSRWTKLSMSLGFIGVCLLLAATLFLFAPRPPTLGFGFVPPGADSGLVRQPLGPGSGGQQAGGADGSSAVPGSGPGGSGDVRQGESIRLWNGMLEDMRRAAADRFIPQWQRSLMQALLGAAQSLLGMLAPSGSGSGDGSALEGPARETERPDAEPNWLLLLALALAAYLLWQRRYRFGASAALAAAWLLAARWPERSMRLSAQAMKWCLHARGHQRGPGQSVREHWASAAGIAPLARRWLGDAIEAYCETRFGGAAATRARALSMRAAVLDASDILLGRAPEFDRQAW